MRPPACRIDIPLALALSPHPSQPPAGALALDSIAPTADGRAHHRRRMTAFRAKATLSPDPLPFGQEDAFSG